MADVKDILENASNATQQQIQNATNSTDATPTTAEVKTGTTTTPTTQETVVQAPTPTVTTQTDTVATTTPTTQTTGDQSQTATVATPTGTTASGTTAVTSTTAASGVTKELASELYTNNPVFNDYAKKSGYGVQVINGNVYVNNTIVDWQKLGMQFKDGKLTGTQAQYDQLLKMVKDNGYATGETFTEFAINAGYAVTRSADGSYIIINGIPVDPTLYDSMTKLNNNWVGKTETYNQMLTEAMQPNKIDPDYLASKNFTQYANKKGYGVSIDGNKHITINGITFAPQYYPGLKWENGAWVGDETTYRQLIVDSQIYSPLDFNQYAKKKGYVVSSNADGYLTISEKGKNDFRATHQPYWDEDSGYVGGMRISWQGESGWRASEAVYDAMIKEAIGRSSYNLEDFARSIGYKVGKDGSGNITINGKAIAGTSMANYQSDINAELRAAREGVGITVPVEFEARYAQAQPTYYSDVYLVDGKFVGSENAYRKILTDLQLRSNESMQDYGTNNNAVVTVLNGKVYIDGNLADISGTSLQLINGKVYGTEADYKKLIDKTTAGYKYESQNDAQIQAALDEIKNFEAYQTPQQTLDQVNQLMQSAQEKFNYDPMADSALKTAQKEAERVVREAAGSKGMLYSSGTVSTAARKAGELIPTYEQQAYGRWSDTKNREVNLLQTIMDWDELQSKRNVDQLNLIKTKFDTIMDMDSRTLEQFKAMLEQRNEDRSYALEMEKMEIERQQQMMDDAWKIVDSLGYVDYSSSIVLGVPVGTKAQWAKQVALEHDYTLQEMAKQNEYSIAQQNSQAGIERSLTEYKAALEEASQLRLQGNQFANEKSLAAQSYANQLYIAKNY